MQLLSVMRKWKSQPRPENSFHQNLNDLQNNCAGLSNQGVDSDSSDFHMRVRWVHVFLIGLISKPCACHDALIPSLSPSKTAFPLLVSLKQMQLLKGGNELPSLANRFLII